MTAQSIRLAIRVPSVSFTVEKRQMRATLRRAGAEVAALAKSKIKGAARSGRVYYGPGGSAAPYRGGYVPGRYQASAPGGAPASITSTLGRSIKVRPFKSGDGVAIRDTAFYALFLEGGAKGGGGGRARTKKNRVKASANSKTRILAPRPFLTAALGERQDSIGERVKSALIDGITFKRIKP